MPFASMWFMDSRADDAEDAWPMPQVRAKVSKTWKPAHLKGLFVYGGQAKGMLSTSDAFYVLPVQSFRNHPRNEWYGHPLCFG